MMHGSNRCFCRCRVVDVARRRVVACDVAALCVRRCRRVAVVNIGAFSTVVQQCAVCEVKKVCVGCVCCDLPLATLRRRFRLHRRRRCP